MSTKDPCTAAASTAMDLSPEEEYMLWSERVRLCFSAPGGGPIFPPDDTTTVYDRHYPSEGIHHREDLPLERDSPMNSVERRTKTTDDFYDEDRFPFCFYARMTRSKHSPSAKTPTDALSMHASSIDADIQQGETANVSFTFSDVEHFSSVSQPYARQAQEVRRLEHDEDAAAARLAARLRSQAFERRREALRRSNRSHATDPFSGRTHTVENFAFADPKVEAVQAAVTEEMTELILALRAANRRNEEVRAQLLYSRTLRELAPNATETSGGDTIHYKSGDHTTEQVEEEYPSDFTE